MTAIHWRSFRLGSAQPAAARRRGTHQTRRPRGGGHSAELHEHSSSANQRARTNRARRSSAVTARCAETSCAVDITRQALWGAQRGDRPRPGAPRQESAWDQQKEMNFTRQASKKARARSRAKNQSAWPIAAKGARSPEYFRVSGARSTSISVQDAGPRRET